MLGKLLDYNEYHFEHECWKKLLLDIIPPRYMQAAGLNIKQHNKKMLNDCNRTFKKRNNGPFGKKGSSFHFNSFGTKLIDLFVGSPPCCADTFRRFYIEDIHFVKM